MCDNQNFQKGIVDDKKMSIISTCEKKKHTPGMEIDWKCALAFSKCNQEKYEHIQISWFRLLRRKHIHHNRMSSNYGKYFQSEVIIFKKVTCSFGEPRKRHRLGEVETKYKK
jgi:hypothetical protein